MTRQLTLFLAAAVLAAATFAQPSIYYLWKNNLDGKTLCNPETPGASWVKVAGPFEDPACSIPQPQ